MNLPSFCPVYILLLLLIGTHSLKMGYHEKFVGVNVTGIDLTLPMQGITVTQIRKTPDFLESFENFDFIVLNTNSPELQIQTIIISEAIEIPAIIVGKGFDTKWSFFTEPDLRCYKQALAGFLKWLDFNKFAIFYSMTNENIELASFLKNEFRYSITSAFYPSSNKKVVQNHLGKFFKAEGIQEFVMLSEIYDCYSLVESFRSLNLEKEWNSAVFGDECFLFMKMTGSLSIVYQDFEKVVNHRSLDEVSINKYIKKIEGKNIDRFQIMKEFSKVQKPCVYSIMNTVNNVPKKVGSILDGVITVFEKITYFGNKQQRTKLKSIPIVISADTNSSSSELYDVQQNSRYHQGTKFMINYINDQRLLKGFEFKLFDEFNCKTPECLASLGDQLGVAYIPSFYYPSVLAIEGLRNLGKTIPVVNGMGTILKNSTLPSNFFRVVSTLDVILQYSVKILKVFGNLNLVVFYSDDPWGIMIYSHLLYLDETKVLKIVNSQEYRKIPFNFSRSMLDDYKQNIQDAYESGCYFVILAMSHPTPFLFLEALYDFGIRKGDFSYFFITPTGPDALQVQDSEQLKKRKELLHGSHFLYGSYWTGKFGEEVRKKYKESEFQTWLPCYYMDAVLSIVKAVEFVLLSGKDYEDYELVTKAIKGSKIVGVTGMILFNEDSLSREVHSISLYNMFEDPRTGEFLIKESARVSPTDLNYLKLDPSVWPQGEIKPQSMKNFYLNCDFFDYKVSPNSSSILKETILNLAVLFISALISLFCILKYKLVSTPMLTTVKFLEPDDYLEIIAVIFEPFQMMSLGPSMTDIDLRFGRFLQVFSLNWLKAFQFRDKTYWGFLCVVISSLLASLALLLVSRLELKLLEKHREKLLKTGSLVKLVMVNFCFVPIFSYLSSVFSCRFSQTSQPAFLDSDCRYSCWENSHILLVVICLALLVVHSTLSYFQKSGEQDFLTKNIRSSQAFFMLKTFLCILIKTLEKVFIIVEVKQKVWFALVFLTCMAVILTFLMKNNAYNFDRLNLWVKVGYFCVVWNTLMYVVGVSTWIHRAWVIVLDLAGWVVVAAIGIRKTFHLPPSLLVAKEGKTVYQMIKLAFNFGILQRLQVYRVKNKDFMKKIQKF